MSGARRAKASSPMDEDAQEGLEPQEIVGEYDDGDSLYYFAKYVDGIAHKFLAPQLEKDYPELVSDYKLKKNRGKLAPFDPTAGYVHPDSRVKVKLKISQKARSSAAAGSSKEEPMQVDSEEEDEEVDEGEEWDQDIPEEGSDEEEDDAESDAYGARPSRKAASGTRRSTRTADKPAPTRGSRRTTRKRYDEDDDEEDDYEPAPSTRRSTRSRKAARPNLDDAYEDDGDEDDDGDYRAKPKAKVGAVKKLKAPVRRKGVRPAYGRVRPVADLDYDPGEDLSTAALRTHRDVCEKCARPPTHLMLLKEKRKPGRKKKNQDDDEEEFVQQTGELGGWVRCLKCPLSAHWACLASTQRQEILKAIRDKEKQDWEAARAKAIEDGDEPMDSDPPKRKELDVDSTTEFLCSMCMKGDFCMSCEKIAIEADQHGSGEKAPTPAGDSGEAPSEETGKVKETADDLSAQELLFRCKTCKRVSHYGCMPVPDGWEVDPSKYTGDRAELAEHYQKTPGDYQWNCDDCASYKDKVEKILAWKAFPDNAPQPVLPPGQAPSPKTMLPRKYLIKWQDRSYRRVTWVPHGWLATTHSGLLRSFLATGPRIELLKVPVTPDHEANDVAEGGVGAVADGSRDSSVRPEDEHRHRNPFDASPDAERRIPPAWKTVDRVLDVRFFRTHQKSKPKGKGKKSTKRVDSSDEEEEPLDDDAQMDWDRAFEWGDKPDDSFLETIEERVDRTEDDIVMEDIDRVVWAYIKWDDLGYDEASWDSPPRRGEPGYGAFEIAFRRLLDSREVHVKNTQEHLDKVDNRRRGEYRKRYSLKTKGEDSQPELGQSPELKLMPFQREGFDWLCDNWWNKQACILADEMGLGKTVQICTFVGHIIKLMDAAPVLVVVPNSTITNWVREFSRWAPGLRVAPFYGEAKSREIIKKYELKHTNVLEGTTGAKFHVLVTTYNTITNQKDFGPVFKSVPRWECLIIDEGQRLNNDNSLLFKKLNELTVLHRIIMTGTPLNNNIRELFNLMNFLDPDKWSDLEALEKEYTELTEDLIKDLHTKLRPYFLRRIKSEVLQLPPKNEVIVPVSLSALQREMYKGILSKNVNVLMSLTQSLQATSTRNSTAAASRSNMNNMLMQLRKVIQHPYLLSQDIEPRGLPLEEAHERLIGASSKLRLLHSLLPKLKVRGHRILLFSQFVIALDIIEDFLLGERYKYLRLDGNTKQADRQKGMDEFNRPDSDVFIYLLTTRAGGVGINLWSADTVIIFDPDFNPHQDLQAIARAHRFGQKKPVAVYKLMAKDTAEERIIQTGKKKLVLDHLIVQKMDDDEGGADVQSILTYGAKTLFEEGGQESREIVYNDHDLDALIERTESEETTEESGGSASGGAVNAAFSFAKIWTADKDALEEFPDDVSEKPEESDSWALTLQRLAENNKEAEVAQVSGRGARRAAAAAVAALKPQHSFHFGDTPTKPKGKGKKRSSESDSDDDFSTHPSPIVEDSDSDTSEEFKLKEPTKRDVGKTRAVEVEDDDHCGLCGKSHPGPCLMADISENLAEYRRILFESSDEPYEDRVKAIAVIDETLHLRGHLHLILEQPLLLAPPRVRRVSPPTGGRSAPPPRPPAANGHAAPSHVTANGSAGPSRLPPAPPRPAPPQGAPAAPSNAVKPPKAIVVPKLPSVQASSAPAKQAAAPRASSVGVKRPAEGEAEAGPSQKRVKSVSAVCPVCQQPATHDVKECPDVAAADMKSITAIISRLEEAGKQEPAVNILRGVRRQLRAREKEAAAAAA